MGQLSFLLAHFDKNIDGFTMDIPKWFSYLESKGIPQSWLCGLQALIVCNFSSRCPHVRIFLDFLENQKHGQSQVKWYTTLNIPVWYPWTPIHQKAVEKDAQLGYLQPPAELLQAAATFVIQNSNCHFAFSPPSVLLSPPSILPSPSAVIWITMASFWWTAALPGSSSIWYVRNRL